MGNCFHCCINTEEYNPILLGPSPVFDETKENDEDSRPQYEEAKSGEPVWVTDPTKAKFIFKSKKGVAARDPARLTDVFEQAVKKQPNFMALRKEYAPNSEVDDGSGRWPGVNQWRQYTWQQYWDESMRAAKSLIALGLEKHTPVNIIGFNSPEWFFADLGAILAGGIAAGVYTTNNPAACQYVAEHSKARVIFVENEKQLNKYLDDSVYTKIPDVKYIVMWDGKVPDGANDRYKQDNSLPAIMQWSEFITKGEQQNITEDMVRERWKGIEPGHCCTLIYTSGTTGNPKAVMMSHDNMTWSFYSMIEAMGRQTFQGAPNKVISYLPLSHIAAQMADIIMPIVATAEMTHGATVTFARPTALKGSLKFTMQATLPTLFFGVPRVWEKFGEAIRKVGKEKAEGCCGCCIKGFGDCWKPANQDAIVRSQIGNDNGAGCCYCCGQFMSGKIRGQLGLTNCKLFITGAAPISQETLLYMAQLGIPVFNMYGMSETSALACGNRHGWHRFGTCGPAMKGVHVRISNYSYNSEEKRFKDNGPTTREIQIRGRNIMMGYMYNPEKTAKTIDEEGYLHSEDQGAINDSVLSITGRIKDLIMGSGGENIAPAPIQLYLEENMPAVSKVCMIGDQRKYNVMLITLKCEGSPQEGFTTVLTGESTEVSENCKTTEDAAAEAKTEGTDWYNYINNARMEYNSNKEICEKNASKIQKFRIIPDGDFDMNDVTGPDGTTQPACLGPTLKVKRPKITQRYQSLIDEMYG